MGKRTMMKSMIKNAVKGISPEALLTEEYIDCTSIDTVNISGSCADIEIYGKDYTQDKMEISFVTYADGPQLFVDVSGNKCNVNVIKDQTYKSLFQIVPSIKLRIFVPANDIDTWAAKSASGDIIFADNRTKHLQLSARAGDIQIENVYAETMKFDTYSGDSKITDVSGDIICTASSGDIDVINLRSTSMSMHTSSGDIELKHIYAEKADFRTSSGDINGSHVYIPELQVNASSGDIELKHYSGGAKGRTSSGEMIFIVQEIGPLDLNTSSGDIDVAFGNSDLNIQMELSTHSGDIKTNVGLTKKHDSISGFSGSIGEAEHLIQLHSHSGDIKVYC